MHFPSLVEPDFDFHLKIILLGDSGVGKSCLLKSFMGKEFTEGYVSTIGVDFEMKQTTVGGKRFRTITTSYYRSCDAILVVFDISDSTSFDNVELWLEDVRSYAKPDVDVILIGNKVDLYLERKVPFETAKRFADNSGMSYIETSAKSHFNVEKAFNTAASYACSKRLKEIAGAEKGVDCKAAQLEVEKEQKRASCC